MATELLGHLPASNLAELVLTSLEPNQPAAIQTAAAKAAASLDDAGLYGQIFENWQTLTTVTRRDVLNGLLRTTASVSVFIDAVANDRVPRTEVPAHVRDALCQNRDPAINERAKKVLLVESTSDRHEVVTKYLATVPATGEASRGVVLFRQHCVVCHAVKGVGQRVGPDLAAVGSRQRDILVVDILDPSRHVTPDFAAYMAMTRQGRVLVGVIAAETPDAITLRRERGEQETVLRSELEELRPTSKSIMPEGFEKLLTPEQLADLLEYLRKPDGF
jgi:putative heme-binding domain-containing protein